MIPSVFVDLGVGATSMETSYSGLVVVRKIDLEARSIGKLGHLHKGLHPIEDPMNSAWSTIP